MTSTATDSPGSDNVVAPSSYPSAGYSTSPDPQDPELKRLHHNGVIVGRYSQAHNVWISVYGDSGQADAHRMANEALGCLIGQHEVARMLARSIRAIRPARMLNGAGSVSRAYDDGYNQALRDVEAILRSAVGQAAPSEGYTAITGRTE